MNAFKPFIILTVIQVDVSKMARSLSPSLPTSPSLFTSFPPQQFPFFLPFFSFPFFPRPLSALLLFASWQKSLNGAIQVAIGVLRVGFHLIRLSVSLAGFGTDLMGRGNDRFAQIVEPFDRS